MGANTYKLDVWLDQRFRSGTNFGSTFNVRGYQVRVSLIGVPAGESVGITDISSNGYDCGAVTLSGNDDLGTYYSQVCEQVSIKSL